MKTKRQQAKAASDKKARERTKKNKKASEVKKKAKECRAIKEVRATMGKKKVPKPSWVKRVLSRQVLPLNPDAMTKEQIHEEFVKIAEKRSTLSRRERAQVEHAHEQQLKAMFGLDKKNKIGKPVPVPEESNG